MIDPRAVLIKAGQVELRHPVVLDRCLEQPLVGLVVIQRDGPLGFLKVEDAKFILRLAYAQSGPATDELEAFCGGEQAFVLYLFCGQQILQDVEFRIFLFGQGGLSPEGE